MSTYLAEFDISDLDMMDMKPGCWAEKFDRSTIETYGNAGPAVTLWADDGTVIACAGVVCTNWKGFGEYWLVPSVHVQKYMKTLYQSAKAFIDDTVDKLGLYRVQATIKEDDHVSIRWIEHLGFEREGLMRKFGPNQENQYLYARVK